MFGCAHAELPRALICFKVSPDSLIAESYCLWDVQWECSSHLLSLSAAPPSMTVLTKIPSFSRPASAPTPIPMMLIPRPSSSGNTQTTLGLLLLFYIIDQTMFIIVPQSLNISCLDGPNPKEKAENGSRYNTNVILLSSRINAGNLTHHHVNAC